MVPPFVIILPHTCNESLMYGSKRLNVPESSHCTNIWFCIEMFTAHWPGASNLNLWMAFAETCAWWNLPLSGHFDPLIYSNSQILCRTVPGLMIWIWVNQLNLKLTLIGLQTNGSKQPPNLHFGVWSGTDHNSKAWCTWVPSAGVHFNGCLECQEQCLTICLLVPMFS